MDPNNSQTQVSAQSRGQQLQSAYQPASNTAPNLNQLPAIPIAQSMPYDSIQPGYVSQGQPIIQGGQAAAMPQVAQHNPAANSNAGNVVYSCPASYVNGYSTFSYHGGTLYVFNDRLVLSDSKGKVYLQAAFSEISEVNYKKSWRTKIINIKTIRGTFQIAPFRVNNRNLIIGYISYLIGYLLARYGGPIGILIIFTVAVVAYVFSFKKYRKNHQTALQMLRVLSQYVRVNQ